MGCSYWWQCCWKVEPLTKLMPLGLLPCSCSSSVHSGHSLCRSSQKHLCCFGFPFWVHLWCSCCCCWRCCSYAFASGFHSCETSAGRAVASSCSQFFPVLVIWNAVAVLFVNEVAVGCLCSFASLLRFPFASRGAIDILTVAVVLFEVGMFQSASSKRWSSPQKVLIAVAILMAFSMFPHHSI